MMAEPVLHPTPILELRPTQLTVGMREVAAKRKLWRDREEKPRELVNFLRSHMVPVILGPKKQRFLIDHHHLALALHEEGAESVFVTVIADLHALDDHDFWNMMEFNGWTHPFDGKGRRRDYSELPQSVVDLEDDPYRSLAGELRAAGGFAKDTRPFSEFVWADFLRTRIKPKALKGDFDAAFAEAMRLAKSPEANYLPGWCAAHSAPPSAKKAGKEAAKAAS